MSWAPWKWRGAKNPRKADLGQELGMYWSPELNRWVEKGKEAEYKKEAEATAAPPSCGPASGPASYTLERTSLQNRYVATPGFSSADGAGKETPPPSFGSLVPKTGARAAPANILVPAPLERKTEDQEGGDESVGSDGGVADPSMDGELGGGSVGEVDESSTGRRLSYGGDQWASASGKPEGWEHGSNGGDEDDTEGKMEPRKPTTAVSTTFLDYQGVTGEGDAVMRGVGFAQHLISENLCDPEPGPFLAGSGSTGVMESDDWRGKGTFDVVDEDMAEQNTVMSSEQPEDGSEMASANRGAGGVESDFSWIYEKWSEDVWQSFYAWLDDIFGRDNWSLWSAEDWTEFWKWYVANGNVTQQDNDAAQPQELEMYEEEIPTITPTPTGGDLQRKHSVDNPRELFQIAFAHGKAGFESQQEHYDRSNQSVADWTENRQLHASSVDSSGVAAGGEDKMALGLDVIRTGASLEDGGNVASPQTCQVEQHGAGSESAVLSGVNSTPLAASSSELGVFEGDGQILKRRSKLTGPLPWEDDEDTADSAEQIMEPSSLTNGQTRQYEQPNALAVDREIPATRKLTPICIGERSRAAYPEELVATREAPFDICLRGVAATHKQSAGAGGEEQEHPGTQENEQDIFSGSIPKRDSKGGETCESTLEDSAREGFGGLPEKQQLFKEPIVEAVPEQMLGQTVEGLSLEVVPSVPGTQEQDFDVLTNKEECAEVVKDEHQPQAMENRNGRIAQPSNGFLGRLEISRTDLGAMLRELEDLLHYVDSSDGRVLTRKENAQMQLVQVMDALGLEEHTGNRDSKRWIDGSVQGTVEPMNSVNKKPEVCPPVEHEVELERLNQELSDMKDDMDDMALALGLESRKLGALIQHCERCGFGVEAIIEGVEENFGIQKDSFQPEDSGATGPSSQISKPDAAPPADGIALLKAPECPSSPLKPAPDPLQLPGLPSDENTNWRDTGVV